MNTLLLFSKRCLNDFVQKIGFCGTVSKHNDDRAIVDRFECTGLVV